MNSRSARGVLVMVGVVSAVVSGFALPASARTAPPKHAPCNCSTTTATTTTSTTTTTAPTTTTEATSTSVGGVTSTVDTTTTFIDIGPPITAVATTTNVVDQDVTSTTHVTSTTRESGEADRLPHTGNSPFFPITFGLACVVTGVVFALRRKPREWYGS